MGEKMRIHIGGLGATVMEDDLRRTFSSPVLGTVESVEIIRSKGRSFAYIDFVPASEKGLSKLFSAYNGCMWKGGRLKLEKAKEHYLLQLRREWTEDADLAKTLTRPDVCSKENMHTWQTTKKDLTTEQMHIRIYFPKLRKIKPLPLKGSGKHKYSFQRVEIPPLPVHFCDCEEHSVPSNFPKIGFGIDLDLETCGVNEDELSMIKSVLSKVLEKENCTKSFSKEIESTEGTYPYINSVDNLPINSNEDDQVSDEDGLVTNFISNSYNGVSLFKDRGQEHVLHGNKNTILVPDNKRKAYVSVDDANVTSLYKRKVKNQASQDHIGDLRINVTTQSPETKSGITQLTGDMAFPKKTSWKDLVNQKGSSAFHISDVLMDHNPEVALATSSSEKDRQQNWSRPDFVSTTSTSEKERHEDRPNTDKELEKVPDVQPIKPSTVEDTKSSRGAAWLQKSSWLQLIGNTSNSSFNLAQIFPGVAPSEKQESQQFNENGVSSSSNKDQENSLPKDQNHTVGGSKHQERADDSTNIAPESPRISLDALTKEQKNHTSPNEQEDADSPPMPTTNKVPAWLPAPVPDIVISDSCPFMRSAASMKEWAKMKATLSVSRKKREMIKESD